SEIEAQGEISIKSRLTENRGNIFATEKVEVTGEKLDNSNGELRSNSKIALDVKDTRNVKGYILSDGLTKEDVKKEEAKENSGSISINTEKGINITGTLDNREGVIRGREITVGGNLTGNSKGKIDSIGALTLTGKIIDNKNGIIKGNIKKINADKL
ncbi:hypothetical protein EII29_11620, partial [Leptotrichia sp. OH3620_COT-345]|uniref:hypothetical protein n=1 Tax=Leptotrichia sp. OH3620_COT-345 TaxID=2491048 RepID=UPI000FAA5E4D